MTTAIIADDEPHMRAFLREQLESLWPELKLLAEAEDGPSALALIETRRPDIAFLDIRMPGLTGLQVAHAITAPTRIVFVTAFDAHAIEAFEASAVDYVLKPVEPTRLVKVVSKLRKATSENAVPELGQLVDALARLGMTVQSQQSASISEPEDRLEWLQVAVGQQIRMLHVDDVMYFESDTKYTRVVANNFEGLIRLSLKQLLDRLDSAIYLQTHRSTVVNRRFIHAVHRLGEVLEIELQGKPGRLKVSLPNHQLFRAM